MKRCKTNISDCKKAELRKAKAKFWRKLLRLTRGRVPLLRALAVTAGEEESIELKQKIQMVLDAMEKGATMSEALALCNGYFSDSVIELIRSAEKTAAWEDILLEIAEGIEEGTFE